LRMATTLSCPRRSRSTSVMHSLGHIDHRFFGILGTMYRHFYDTCTPCTVGRVQCGVLRMGRWCSSRGATQECGKVIRWGHNAWGWRFWTSESC
jgi:hypothetical protein